jgi:hypothetical protein
MGSLESPPGVVRFLAEKPKFTAEALQQANGATEAATHTHKRTHKSPFNPYYPT